MKYKIKLEFLGNYTFRILEDIEYKTEAYGNIKVPEGFVTDLASTPRIVWSFFPPHGKYAPASILHDYLYTTGTGSKYSADNTFLEVMTQLEVPYFRRKLVYLAVKLFGKGNFKPSKPNPWGAL